MAENITLNPSTARSSEAHPPRLPFAPIFDTIVAEAPSDAPSAAEQPATQAPMPPLGDGNAPVGSVLFQNQGSQPQFSSTSDRVMAGTIALGVIAIVVAVIYLDFQLRSQRQGLTELVNSSSRLASTVADSRKLEQRPWVAIADVVPQLLSVAPGTFNVSLQNLGKTPALQLNISATAQLAGSPEGLGTQAIAPVNHAAGTLFPGSQFRTLLDFRLAPAVLGGLYRGQGHLVLHIAVAYTDIFQASHLSQACWSWQPAFREMEPCSESGTVN